MACRRGFVILTSRSDHDQDACWRASSAGRDGARGALDDLRRDSRPTITPDGPINGPTAPWRAGTGEPGY